MGSLSHILNTKDQYPMQGGLKKALIMLTHPNLFLYLKFLITFFCENTIYIYKRLRPRKKNPQQKKRKSRKSNFFNEIEHQTS
jgi:hypothetical protein